MYEWPITATSDEDSFLDDHIDLIVSAELPELPPHEQSIGETAVRWDRVGNDQAFIQAQGGTPDDRVLARSMVAEQLRDFGIREATQNWDTFQRTADWNDIMDKARRLIQDGQVRILRNGYNNIVGWVKGDHGEYNPEIFRQDPSSRAITGSDCGCNWGEFQNQPRTRNWKRYQDRPCSHILATYWKALATPLDEDLALEQAQQQGQAPPSAAPQPGPPQAAPQGAPGAPGAPPQGGPPQLPGVQQQPVPGQEGPSPADVLPQFQQPPVEVQQNPASVPGLRGPTPTNPINYPPGPGGTFSSVRSALGDELEDFDNFYHVAPAAAEQDIAQHGIHWERQQGAGWREDPEDWQEYPQGNYLWTRLQPAQELHQMDPRGTHLYEVKYPHSYNDELAPDPAGGGTRGSEYEHAVYTPNPIPPEWTRRIASSWHEAAPWSRHPPPTPAPVPRPTSIFQPWEPGSYGKGFVSPSGGVIHWRTTSANGRPNHTEGMWTFGVANPNAEYRNLHPFIVDPQGHLSPHYPDWVPDDVQAKMLSAHPAFQPDTNGEARWAYMMDHSGESGVPASRASMWREATDEPIPQTDERDPRWTTPLNNGDLVQLMTNYDTGIQQGRPESGQAGTEMPLPQGLVGEVLGSEGPIVHVLWMGKPWDQNSYYEPYGAIGQHFRGSLLHRPDLKRPGPALRRAR